MGSQNFLRIFENAFRGIKGIFRTDKGKLRTWDLSLVSGSYPAIPTLPKLQYRDSWKSSCFQKKADR